MKSHYFGISSSTRCIILALVAFLLVVPAVVSAGAPAISEAVITATPEWETSPALGNDGVSDIVVYTKMTLLPDNSFGPGSIWY